MKSTVFVSWKQPFLVLFILSSFFAASAQLLVHQPKPFAILATLAESDFIELIGSTGAPATEPVAKDKTVKVLSKAGLNIGVTEKLQEAVETNNFSTTFAPVASTGGGILVVSGSSNKFSQYTTEILKAEGLNGYSTSDISAVTADMLNNYDVAVVGNISLTDAQVSMFSSWINAGGTLIAFKPDVKLAQIMGLTFVGGTLANKYLLVNTSTGPGKGIVNQTIQYQGAADLYTTTSGTTTIAMLYSGASTATNYPAVSSRSVGSQGGKAVAFTYDLPKSIVYTRQGNPQWSGQKRDGQSGPIRSDDQYYPDWVDLNKVAIPQADEQQRLLANIITLNSRKPTPRFWYLPRGLKAAVVMTGDDHGNGGTKSRFNQYLQLSSDNSAEAVADWRAIRGTSYIYPNTPLTDTEARSFEQQGFEIALHLNTNCDNFTPSSLQQNLTTQLAEFKSIYPSVAPPATNRTHCIAWSDWSTQAKLESPQGIRLDANYYYWPSAWIQNRPGMFTGSGIPMRFADLDGSIIDTYQLTTQMTDESDQSFPYTIDQLLDKALGPEGYYGVFCANMHTDSDFSFGSDAIISSAISRDVPVISSRQLLTWLDGRNGSVFNAITWNGSELNFQVNVADGARSLQGMLPMTEATGRLVGLSLNGAPVAFRTEIVKGVEYAFFPASTGSYLATYDINALPNNPPEIALSSPVENSTFEAPATITLEASATDLDGTVVSVEFYSGSVKLGEDINSGDGWSFTWSNVEAGLYSITARAIDNAGAVTSSAAVNINVSAVCPCTVFKPSDSPTNSLINDGQGIQVGMKFRSSIDGYVSGVRFYKQSGNTGTHTGQLYTNTGTLLAEATFVNETASGWQEVAFTNPVPVTAGATYVISYHSSSGFYSETDSYFGQAINRLPLIGLANGEDGPNGVYVYSSSPGFPTNTFQSSNYWVDVVFSTDSPPNKFPTVSLTSPTSNASYTAPASVALAATAADVDGSVVKVEFFQGTTKLGEDLTSPYSYTWNDVPAGNYSLSAKVTDNRGDVTTSEEVNIAVTAISVQNDIVAENALPGSPESEWQISGAGDLSIQGFATDISYNKGETARFKIKTDANAYSIKIYRLGYYQGNGARYQGDATVTANLPQSQPNCLTNSTTGLIDCGNWAESASWAIPSNAVSGIYIAKLSRSGGGSSHIVFIVRDDASNSDLFFQTSDATWQAYNIYGGKSLYTGDNGKAEKVSYNRPFVTRNGGGGGGPEEDWVFNAEYPMVRWIEANGYDVTYTTNVDSDRRGNLIANHRVFMSVGHDEYWSGAHRANVTAARNSGTSLAFFSGNEVYWKTRWENSIDGSGTSYRTLVCYKEGSEGENVCNGKCDPSNEWTGLWRSGCEYKNQDPLACNPENELTGQISWAENTAALQVPSTYKNLRFWRNTSVAALGDGQTATLTNGIIGYEWNPEQEEFRSSYPNGRIILSRTVLGGNVHNFSLYRHASGAFVFGAGTVQYSWGLDSNHDRGSTAPSPALQQATVNLLADMGAQPRSLQSGLVAASASTDTQAPVTVIANPAEGTNIALSAAVTISGTASDNSVVAGVEISTDGGNSWRLASGTTNWTFSWTPSVQGAVTLLSRAFDDSGNMSAPVSVSVTVGGSGPVTCPCTVFSSSSSPTGSAYNDNQGGIQVGMRFRSSIDGNITGVRFYKQSNNTGTHIGQLYSNNGTLLAEATFVNETTSGWQEVSFSNPVAITAGVTYVISYHSSNGYYSATNPYFTQGVDNNPLRGLANGEDGSNGVYSYSQNPTFPTNNYQSSNYWVDAVFNTETAPLNQPPVLSSPIADQVATVGVAYSFTFAAGTFTDADAADVLTYSASLSDGSALPSWLSFEGASRTFGGTPDAAGTLSIRVTADDGRGGTVSDDFALAVSAPLNQPPVLASIGNKSVNELSTLTFSATSTDDGLPSNSLTYSLQGAVAEATINPITGAFSWTPDETQGPGTYSFTIKVSDGTLSDEEEIVVQVNEVNQAPILATIGDKEIGRGGTLRFNLIGTDEDVPAQMLTYSANKLPSGATLDAISGEFVWTPTDKQTGRHRINFRLTDGISQVSENVTITVSNTTVPPPSISGFSPISGYVGDIVVISGSNFNGTNSVTFNGVNATSFTVIDASTIRTTVPTGAESGIISVKTPYGTAVSGSSFTVLGVSNAAPQVSLISPTDNANFKEPANILIEASASDSDGSVTKVEFYQGNTILGVDISGSDGWSYNWNGVPARTDAYVLTAKATDNTGAVTTSEAVNVWVYADNIFAPIVSGFSPGSGSIGDAVVISGNNFTGANSVTFNGVQANFIIDNVSTITAYVPTGATTGKVSVTTPGGTALSSTDFIILTNSIQPPVVSGFSPLSGAVGSVVTISGVNLAGASNVSFGPSAANIISNTDTEIQVRVPSTKGKLPKSYSVSVTTAAGSATANEKFTVTSATLSANNINSLQQAEEQASEQLQVYPNPFSEKATIRLYLQEDTEYTLNLYDEKGELVRVLKQGDAIAGERFTVEVDGSSLTKGLYLVRLQTNNGVITAKLILDK